MTTMEFVGCAEEVTLSEEQEFFLKKLPKQGIEITRGPFLCDFEISHYGSLHAALVATQEFGKGKSVLWWARWRDESLLREVVQYPPCSKCNDSCLLVSGHPGKCHPIEGWDGLDEF